MLHIDLCSTPSATRELEREADQDQITQVELRMEKYCKKRLQVTWVQEVKDLPKLAQLVSSTTTL